MLFVKLAVLVLSLGIDTLMVSIGLGVVQRQGKLKIAVTFAIAEALMPLIGIFVGRGTGHFLGHYGSLAGSVALLAVAVWMLFFDHDDDELDDDDDDGVTDKKNRLQGWSLLAVALSISLDELAVGFSLGLVGVPIVLTLILLALQAFLFTLLGLSFGKVLKPFVGEWAEKLAGGVLFLLGLWLLIEATLLRA